MARELNVRIREQETLIADLNRRIGKMVERMNRAATLLKVLKVKQSIIHDATSEALPHAD